jgi:hypothetical protein
VNGFEVLGPVGDMLALVGLASGLPLVLIGWMWWNLDGSHVATEIVIVPGEGALADCVGFTPEG